MTRNLAIREVAERPASPPGRSACGSSATASPSPQRTPAGYRLYSPEDVDAAAARRRAARGRPVRPGRARARPRRRRGPTDRPVDLRRRLRSGGRTPRVLRKRTLIALSRAIEDETLAARRRPGRVRRLPARAPLPRRRAPLPAAWPRPPTPPSCSPTSATPRVGRPASRPRCRSRTDDGARQRVGGRRRRAGLRRRACSRGSGRARRAGRRARPSSTALRGALDDGPGGRCGRAALVGCSLARRVRARRSADRIDALLADRPLGGGGAGAGARRR